LKGRNYLSIGCQIYCMSNPRINDKLRKLTPVIGEQAKALASLYAVSSPDERMELESIIDSLLLFQVEKTHQPKTLLAPADNEELTGEYPLGKVVYPKSTHKTFGLKEAEWLRHILICGASGSGKTNLTFVILDELRKKDKPFLVFDWKKNYRDLLQKKEYADLRVYTIGEESAPFHFNPLIPPPGVAPGQWLGQLLDVLCHAYFVGHGVAYLLREEFQAIFQELGIFDGSQQYPSFREAYERLRYRRMKGRESLWKASTMRVLSQLCWVAGLGPYLDTDKPLAPETLLNRSVVFEMDALSDADKTFFTEVILLWLYEYKKHNTRKREQFEHAIIVEEAHHVLSRRKEKATGGETVMEFIVRQIREMGNAIIIIDQEPSKLANSVLANTSSKFILTLGNGRDIHEMVMALALEKEHREYIDRLDIGEALVKVKGRVNTPILVKFPHYEIEKGKVTNSILQSFMLWNSDSSAGSNGPRASRDQNRESNKVRDSIYIPPGLERKFLAQIKKFPDFGVKEHYKELGVSIDKGNKCKKYLLKKGKIKEVQQGRKKCLEIVEEEK
jgi:hypothetical protein